MNHFKQPYSSAQSYDHRTPTGPFGVQVKARARGVFEPKHERSVFEMNGSLAIPLWEQRF